MRIATIVPLLLAAAAGIAHAAGGPVKMELVDVRRIWAEAPHSAFTDLLRHDGRWWCVFREGKDHVAGDDGVIRVITSADGEKWESAALLREAGVDLRDPKISLRPDGKLMLLMGGSVYGGTKKLKGRRPRVSFSDDGREWTNPQPVLAGGDWLWRVTWVGGVAYGVSYHADEGDNTLVLYRSKDGLAWEKVTPLNVPGKANEVTVRGLADGRMMAFVRREGGNTRGWIGTARAPYEKWEWNETQHRLGGPEFLQLPDGRLVGSTRAYGPKVSTVVGWMTEASFEPVLTLPSGGDTSYPGMVWHDGMIWMSYYSSHEKKTAIYLARIKVR